jgi:hypothetical protein
MTRLPDLVFAAPARLVACFEGGHRHFYLDFQSKKLAGSSLRRQWNSGRETPERRDLDAGPRHRYAAASDAAIEVLQTRRAPVFCY